MLLSFDDCGHGIAGTVFLNRGFRCVRTLQSWRVIENRRYVGAQALASNATGIPSRFVGHSHRDANGNPGSAKIPAVVQVIPAIVVLDVDIVGLVPVRSPVLWIRINETEPIPTVLETRIPAYLHKGKAVDPEVVTPTVVVLVVGVRNAVAVIAAALLPGAMFVVPALGTTLLPAAPLFAFLGTLLLLRAN
jgi:hypothetical protein